MSGFFTDLARKNYLLFATNKKSFRSQRSGERNLIAVWIYLDVFLFNPLRGRNASKRFSTRIPSAINHILTSGRVKRVSKLKSPKVLIL